MFGPIEVFALKIRDEQWGDMKAVYDACEQAHVALPAEVEEYFEGKNPDETEICVSPSGYRTPHESYTRFWDGNCNIIQVDLTKLPKGVTHIQFRRRG